MAHINHLVGWSYRHSRARNARGSRCICACAACLPVMSVKECAPLLRVCQGVRPAVCVSAGVPAAPVACCPANGCRPSNTHGGDLLTTGLWELFTQLGGTGLLALLAELPLSQTCTALGGVRPLASLAVPPPLPGFEGESLLASRSRGLPRCHISLEGPRYPRARKNPQWKPTPILDRVALLPA